MNEKNTTEQGTGRTERLNKFIAANGHFSRRKIDEFILEGRVAVNGKEIFDLGTKINPDTDKVFIDGERVRVSDKKIYLMLNKPLNVITSVSDDKKRTTVVDLVNTKTKIFPVGRLDFHTTGLLILTNDGDFTNKLMNPAFKIYKTYEVKLSRPLDQKHRQLLEKGIKLDGVYTLPAIIVMPNEKDYSEVRISISQGKNRQVRRMFENFGYFVDKLHRSGYGSLQLGNLREGEFRKMTNEEVQSLTSKSYVPAKSISKDEDSKRELQKELRREAKRESDKKKFSDKDEKPGKRNLTRGNKDIKTAKKKFSKDFKKNGPKKNISKNFSKNYEGDEEKSYTQSADIRKDYKKKFSGDTRAYKGGKKFSDIPKESLREDSFSRDSKRGFSKPFAKSFDKDNSKRFSKSNEGEKRSFSKDVKKDFKPDYKKDGAKSFGNSGDRRSSGKSYGKKSFGSGAPKRSFGSKSSRSFKKR